MTLAELKLEKEKEPYLTCLSRIRLSYFVNFNLFVECT